jgi:predicted membrane metal-binding protein
MVKKGISHASKEEQRSARRQLVILLSAFVFVLLPMFPIVIIMAVWLSKLFGDTIELMEAPIIIGVLAISCLIIGIISSTLWEILISFYLTIEELKDIAI